MKRDRNDYYTKVLEELRRAIEENKITQAEAGTVLGVSQGAVSQLLNGRSKLTLEQFFLIADLLGTRPQKLLNSADVSLTNKLPMPEEVEEILYRSEIHLLAYTAATQDVTVDDIATDDYPDEAVREALDELVAVGVLRKKKDKYEQVAPNTTYEPSTRERSNQLHQAIMVNAWRQWERNRKRASYRGKRFNYYQLDRFTVTQIKEIESMLWKVYERIESFQRENMANGYHSDDPMPLWNLHLALLTPLE